MANSLKPEKYLYTAFLKNKRVYNLAVAFWRKLVAAIARNGDMAFQYHLSEWGPDGQRTYDGNPIFAAYFPKRKRSLRIIQDEPEPGKPDWSAWTGTAQALPGEETPELTLALALNAETAAIARALINAWLIDELSLEDMNVLIQQQLPGMG